MTKSSQACDQTVHQKKVYEKPRIVFAEQVQARAMGCAKSSVTDTMTCLQPLQS